MVRIMKAWTSGSSRIASLSAPVSAETGFIVMLPQSLYQTSRRTSALASASKPDSASAAQTAPTRAESPPAGSPTISRSPKPCRTRPGSGHEAVRWTTQPRTRAIGSAASSRPPGSTLSSGGSDRRGRGHEPPGHAVHRRQHDGRRAEQRRDLRRERRQRRCLQRDHHQLLRPERPRLRGDGDPRHRSPAAGIDQQAALAHARPGSRRAPAPRRHDRPRPGGRRSARRPRRGPRRRPSSAARSTL